MVFENTETVTYRGDDLFGKVGIPVYRHEVKREGSGEEV